MVWLIIFPNSVFIVHKFEHSSWRGVLDTTQCDIVGQCLAADRWLSPGNPVNTNTTDRHDITELLLKVALNTISLRPYLFNIKKMQVSNISDYAQIFIFAVDQIYASVPDISQQREILRGHKRRPIYNLHMLYSINLDTSNSSNVLEF
jgi:hypothetical protein